MSGSAAVTGGQDGDRRGIERDSFAGVGEDKVVAINSTAGIEPGWQLETHLRVCIQRGRRTVGRPAFEKSFALRDP